MAQHFDGDRLKMARSVAGLTHARLASLLQIKNPNGVAAYPNKDAVARWEAGSRSPSGAWILPALAGILGVEMADFYSAGGE